MRAPVSKSSGLATMRSRLSCCVIEGFDISLASAAASPPGSVWPAPCGWTAAAEAPLNAATSRTYGSAIVVVSEPKPPKLCANLVQSA